MCQKSTPHIPRTIKPNGHFAILESYIRLMTIDKDACDQSQLNEMHDT